MKSDLNMPIQVDGHPNPQPIRLSYWRDGSYLPSIAPLDLRLPQFQFMASLSSPWTRDLGASAMNTGNVAHTPVALSPPSPSLDGWFRDPFADDVWLDPALRGWPTATFVRLYVLGCDGLFALHKLLGTSQFKIGLTEQKVEARIRELNRDSYASHYVGVAGWTGAEGFCDWHPKTPVVGQMPSPASPVVVMSDCIGIHLPECLSLRDFDRALAQHLESVCIDRWFRRPEIAKELTQKNVDPGVGRRGTLATDGGIDRVEEAHELFFFRPRREFGALVAIAEHIILRALRQANTNDPEATINCNGALRR